LDEDTIVAFIAARLEPDRIAGVEAHVRACGGCGQLLTVALGAARGADEVARSRPRGGSPGEVTTLARGSAFGRYTVLGPLGRGAMGEVFAAYDPELDRKVALKILHAIGGGAADERSRSRLLREAKAIAKLRHPNVVMVLDAGRIDDHVFLAMEYVEGRTLAAWLGERARDRQAIIDVFVAAGRGLGAAHAAAIAHRDFKPQNVMVDSAGGVRVMDFGLAREIGTAESTGESPDEAAGAGLADVRMHANALPLTRTGELIGTPLYMAPEAFKTQRADARSDQFSFCVALHQALYGTHPFGGNNLGELMAAVTAGRILPAPPKTTVPLWLRRVLVRGLGVDPAVRWPSMEALTAALLRDPARNRRRWLAGGAIAAVAIGAFAAARPPSGKESICRRGPERLLGVWELADGASAGATRRVATRASFLETGVDHAADAWDRAAGILDRYTAGWLRMYQETCAATHERGDQSVEVLDLRMACLSERLGRVKALTDVFADANATVVDNAVPAAGALPTLDRCADVASLRAIVSPPDDPATRARVAALRRELARIMALQDSGQCDLARGSRDKLIADADQLGYLPLEADVLLALTHTQCLSYEENVPNCKRAALAGLASRDDEAVIEAAICIATYQADVARDTARARDWIELASAMMQRAPGSYPVLETWRLRALANIYVKEGETDRALETSEKARALTEKTQGTEHLDYARTLNDMGVLLSDLARFEQASDYYRRGAELALKVGGPNNATAGLCFVNAAETLNALGRYAEAETAAEKALGIYHRVGTTPLMKGYALTMLGQSLLARERFAAAAAPLQEAFDLLKDGSTIYTPTVQFALARTLWASPESRPRALALAREAKTGFQRFANQAPEVTKIDAWLREHTRAR
jgi:tetratricopeptide (TPR) repeat protein